MKTSCPICGFETEILDEKIRKRGRNVTCPRCGHTYFVERSTYSDLDRIEDSAGPDIIPKVGPAVERDWQDEEEKQLRDKGRSGEDDSAKKIQSVVYAIFLTVFALFSMLGGEIPIGILAILVAAIILLVEFMVES